MGVLISSLPYVVGIPSFLLQQVEGARGVPCLHSCGCAGVRGNRVVGVLLLPAKVYAALSAQLQWLDV